MQVTALLGLCLTPYLWWYLCVQCKSVEEIVELEDNHVDEVKAREYLSSVLVALCISNSTLKS